MNIRTLFTVYAVLLGFSVVVLFAPKVILIEVYGIAEPSGLEILLYRVINAFGVGLAVMAWFARGAEPSPARDALVLGLAVLNGVSAVAVALGVLAGATNAGPGWATAILFAVFAVLFFVASRAGRRVPAGALP